MAHNLDQIAQGIHSFVSARENAWHRLGTVLESTFTAEEAMTHAHLGGWNVRKLPLTATQMDENGVTSIEVPNQFATVRTNPITGAVEPLGVVGTRYTVIQNEEHAEFLNTLVDESGAHFETAGALAGGRRTFMSMRMPQHIEIDGDVTNLYLIAVNSHDGTDAFRVFTSLIRPVCQNTVTAAIRGAKSSYSIRHTASALGRVQDVRQALGMTFKYVESFQQIAEGLYASAFSDREFEQFLNGLFDVTDPEDVSTRKSNQMDTLRALWNSSPTLLGTRGTRLGAYNAVTEFTSHFAGAHGKNRDEQITNRAARDAFDDKQRTKALDLLTV